MYDVPLTRNLQAWTLLPTDIFPLHYPLRITVFLSFLIESGYLNLLASVLLLLLIINEARHWAKKEKRYFLLNFFHDGIKHTMLVLNARWQFEGTKPSYLWNTKRGAFEARNDSWRSIDSIFFGCTPRREGWKMGNGGWGRGRRG